MLASIASIGVLTVLFLPAVPAAREAPRRIRRIVQPKSIHLTLPNSPLGFGASSASICLFPTMTPPSDAESAPVRRLELSRHDRREPGPGWAESAATM
jgi:hypothetical protein